LQCRKAWINGKDAREGEADHSEIGEQPRKGWPDLTDHKAAPATEHRDESRSLAQAVGGQGVLTRPEWVRGSVQTEHVVDFTRRSESKASEWLKSTAGTAR